MTRLTSYLPKFVSVTLVLFACLVLATATAQALPVIIPNFATDTSGTAYTIQAIPETDDFSNNITAAPSLNFAVTAPAPDNTVDTLSMNWTPVDSGQPAQAGWELVFGVDPDLRGGTISLSVNAPGGTNTSGDFVGITDISVIAIDMGGLVAGGWSFNTDQLGATPASLSPPADDPTSANGVSLLNNVMHDVLISIPSSGPILPGSAVVTQVSPAGPFFIGPNNIIPSTNGDDFSNIIRLQFFENGILRGETGIPGTGVTDGSLINFWDHLSITVPEAPVPEPSTSLMLLGLLGFAAKRRKYRQA